MSFLADLLPFQEAVNAMGARVVLPTSLDTAALRQMEAGVRRASFFSAENLLNDVLQSTFKDIESLLNPQTVLRDGKPVTEGLDLPTARLRMKEALRKAGYSPNPDERGTLRDLSSDSRINLVLRTNVEMMQGVGNFIQGQDPAVLDAFPAQELVRFQNTKVHRPWHQRWLEAAVYSGDTDAPRILSEFGRMVARKDSPIWDALGSSDLFDDGLDNPYPPFAFNSGMWVQDVDRDTAQKMGLITPNDTPAPQKLDIESLFKFAA